MAKSLEEHLYRSAQTKEEYLDPKTLKQRLQTIAQGLDLHRPPRPGGMGQQGMLYVATLGNDDGFIGTHNQSSFLRSRSRYDAEQRKQQ